MLLLITQSAAFIDSSAGAKRRPGTKARLLSPRGDWVGASAVTVTVRDGPDAATQRRCNAMRHARTATRCTHAAILQGAFATKGKYQVWLVAKHTRTLTRTR
jgi:hypothetical protein